MKLKVAICLALVLYLLLPLSGSEAAKIEIRISGLWSPNSGLGQDLHRTLNTRFPDYEIVAGTKALGKFDDIAAALSSGEDDLVWDSSALGQTIIMWAI